MHELADERGRPLGVVHRDVNPHNILASRSGLIKIVDFGVVKARGQVHQTTKAGEMKGDPAPPASASPLGGQVWVAPASVSRGTAASGTLPLTDSSPPATSSLQGLTPVDVQWLNPPAAVLSSPAPDTPESTLEIHETAPAGASLGTGRLLAIGLAGGGVLGLVVGTGFGLDALSKRNAAREVCPNTCSSAAGSALWSSAGRSADISTVAFVVGAAGLVAGTLLWIYSETPRNSAAPTVRVGLGLREVEVAGQW